MARRDIGTTDVTPSGGTVTLIGRRGEGWLDIGDPALADGLTAVARSEYGDPVLGDLEHRPGSPPFLAPGQVVCLHSGRSFDTARVVRDTPQGLVAWVPSGTSRLSAVRADGGSLRSVPLRERAHATYRMVPSTWNGPGTVRVYPAGDPWSVWWFRDDSSGFAGWYVNVELPHRRPSRTTEPARTHTRDLTLDLWLERDDAGAVEVWLKDADELEVAVESGKYSAERAAEVRGAAERFCREVVEPWGWPLSESGLESWQPPAELAGPIPLPDTELVRQLTTHSPEESS